MKSGKCPKCGGEEIFVNTTETHGIRVPLGLRFVDTEEYVCGTCGYMEFYVQHKSDLERVPQTFRKVNIK